MYRDFSEQSKNKLSGMVSEIENEQYSVFTDWIGDRWYDFESLIGKLNIKNYINNVNEYHKKVLDKNNTTKSTIENIFRNVKSIDSSYQVTLNKRNYQLQQWLRYINELSQNINPSNGKFNAGTMSTSLNDILSKISDNELSMRLDDYIEFDNVKNEYVYNWKLIDDLFNKPTDTLTNTDYQILTYILSTMVDENGMVDENNLQTFINLGYTTPSKVTNEDYHMSFITLPNGDKQSYYYIQNKSYMGDTLKNVCAIYDNVCLLNQSDNNLNTIMKSIAENYSVIEWRKRLDFVDSIIFSSMEYVDNGLWERKLAISEDALNEFNSMCVPNISIEFVNNVNDGSGLDYYVITSNSENIGDVLTATKDGQFVNRNDVSVDNFVNSTIRVYIDCENQSSDVVASILNGRSILSEYYQEFSWSDVLTDEAVSLVSKVPVAGNYISALYDIAKQTEASGAVSSVIKGTASIELKDITNISDGTEKKIDSGLGVVNKGIGIYTKYVATEKNNERVSQNQDELIKLSKPAMQKKNLGLVYDTMVVKYDHCTYTDKDSGIKVDTEKNCDKAKCEISYCGYEYDSLVLRNQYDSIMHTKISDEEFSKLEEEVLIYIKTGDIDEDGILTNYIKEWS